MPLRRAAEYSDPANVLADHLPAICSPGSAGAMRREGHFAWQLAP